MISPGWHLLVRKYHTSADSAIEPPDDEISDGTVERIQFQAVAARGSVLFSSRGGRPVTRKSIDLHYAVGPVSLAAPGDWGRAAP